MILCSCTSPVKHAPPFQWQCVTCGKPITEIQFIPKPAPAAVVSPSLQNGQRAIDIANLRFYSAMAHDFKWQTDIIHHSVIVQTLAEIAERLAVSSPSPEGAEKPCSRKQPPGPADVPCCLGDGHEGICKPDYEHKFKKVATPPKAEGPKCPKCGSGKLLIDWDKGTMRCSRCPFIGSAKEFFAAPSDPQGAK